MTSCLSLHCTQIRRLVVCGTRTPLVLSALNGGRVKKSCGPHPLVFCTLPKGPKSALTNPTMVSRVPKQESRSLWPSWCHSSATSCPWWAPPRTPSPVASSPHGSSWSCSGRDPPFRPYAYSPRSPFLSYRVTSLLCVQDSHSPASMLCMGTLQDGLFHRFTLHGRALVVGRP